ncbi:diphosphomevalonate decarboxylase [Bifidobacterium aemilianum]|uniref:diphosphomevalonate decarboxylase n=1 Tax=Bifidobacterium aemilianum TaxID=2493120 RepID=A0A366K837_9BIFI|nr:diphosphomevalonate decarboxylase [Bifidobacterium aemilianum]RBP97910.1 diphosphomevalonate decarboxylase [Bifidobacterium aemilianum]
MDSRTSRQDEVGKHEESGLGRGRASALANANIALIKYWGKADEALIIPRTSSLSLTLDGLSTETTVEFVGNGRGAMPPAQRDLPGVPDRTSGPRVAASASSGRDSLTIDGVQQSGKVLDRVSKVLDLVRAQAGINAPAHVSSTNTVPYGAGLASSSSAFAALAGAAAQAAGLRPSRRELSRLARRGSGSACRSVYGGLVKWNAGHDDASSYAEPVDNSMDLAIVVILISNREKHVSSRDAMVRTIATSPLYESWVQQSGKDLDEALAAISTGDLERLGAVVEANAMGMHAAMIASRPPTLYWLPETIRALGAVEELRGQGLPAWSTMDAGPNVKVLTSGRDAERLADELRSMLPACRVQVHRPGAGLRVFDESGVREAELVGQAGSLAPLLSR